MSSNLINQALEIVDEALSLDDAQRPAFVVTACGNDTQLLAEVESFLEYRGGVTIALPNADSSALELPELPASHDRYTLQEEIARGGMGAVYRAFDQQLNRVVAVKVVLPSLAASLNSLRRFVVEAQIAALLQHPGVAPVYDIGRLADGRPFFAMKLVQGETLSTLLDRREDTTTDLSRFLTIFTHLCQTVAYAHSHRIIHRDLKPDNVMVGQFGEVQVMDWGLAKELTGNDRSADEEEVSVQPSRQGLHPSDTRSGVVMGTPAYMSPEQLAGRRDTTTDVFALGAILCEILTGKPPYTADTPVDVYGKSSRGDTAEAFERLDTCGCDVELACLTKQCLAADPKERCQDARQVAELITTFIEAGQTRLRAAEISAARAEAVAREERKRRRTTLALAAVSVTIVVSLAGGWLWLARQRAIREDKVQAALDEARVLHERAASAPLTALGPWIEARAAVARAEALVQGDLTTTTLAPEVEWLSDEIDKAEAERKLLLAIERARDKVFVIPEYEQPLTEFMRDNLALAFHQQLIHPDTCSVEAGVDRIRSLSPEVKNELLGALDEWLLVAEDPQRQWLLQILSRSDTDAWRKSWRDAYLRNDGDALVALFLAPEMAGQPSRSILNLAFSLGAFLSAGDVVQALQHIQPLHANDFWFNARLGAMAWERNQSLDALSYYSAALAIRPSGPLHRVISDVLMHMRRYEEAVAHLQQAVKLSPDMYEQWEFLGEGLKRIGRDEEAIEAFREALALQPDAKFSLIMMGDSLRTLGRHEQAIEVLERALRLYPEDTWCRIHLGLALNADRRLVEAVHTFEPLLQRARGNDYGLRIRQESKRMVLAALAASEGDAKDAAELSEEDRVYLRGQALAWLRLRLRERLIFEPASLLEDPGYAIVRDEELLASLAAEERAAWETFWQDLERYEAEATEKHEQTRRAVAACQWEVIKPESMRSAAGAEFQELQDGSVLVSGVNQPNDDYTIVATVPTARIAALRLEVLADPSLPNQGPGRHETGNFQLAEVEIDAADADTGQPWPSKVSNIWASYSWLDRPVENAIDGELSTAWHVWGQLGKPHVAVLTLESPWETTNPVKLTVKLRHGGDLGPGIGRFRLSFTSDQL